MASGTKSKAKDMETDPIEQVQAPAAPVESVYTAEELAGNHKIFHTSHEIVVIALRLAGKKTATLAEATSIIEKFKNKEVK